MRDGSMQLWKSITIFLTMVGEGGLSCVLASWRDGLSRAFPNAADSLCSTTPVPSLRRPHQLGYNINMCARLRMFLTSALLPDNLALTELVMFLPSKIGALLYCGSLISDFKSCIFATKRDILMEQLPYSFLDYVSKL